MLGEAHLDLRDALREREQLQGQQGPVGVAGEAAREPPRQVFEALGGGALRGADGRTALGVAGLTGDERERQKTAPALQEALDAAATGAVAVYVTGSSPLNAAVVEQEDRDLARAESIGLPIALLVLIIAFGSLVAAGLPLLTFVVLFGLSMDYEVFLISRMKEEWARTRDNRAAVTAGLVHTAGVITAAAAIMIIVFAAFMITDVVEVKQMGFALAVAVAVDATLIRVVVVPAFMRLAGRANWWFPAPFSGRGGGAFRARSGRRGP
ncbi:MMPL family transporter [Actinomadura sp. NAK00032]|uniref:MMPL family transporter n=1 Tax=Actinomadura sp. NAK00032 TaxID=2742128 RepID=UPI0020C78F84|nr:MMPL family transporter [Actinomadura sp. NAK00032]